MCMCIHGELLCDSKIVWQTQYDGISSGESPVHHRFTTFKSDCNSSVHLYRRELPSVKLTHVRAKITGVIMTPEKNVEYIE
jgi:hypothetical protein